MTEELRLVEIGDGDLFVLDDWSGIQAFEPLIEYTNTEQTGAQQDRHRKPRPSQARLKLIGAIASETCAWCGETFGDVTDGRHVHIDHIVPLAEGGQDALDNMQLLHADCNRRKATRPMSDAPWRQAS